MEVIKFFKFIFYFLISIICFLLHVLVSPICTLAEDVSEWATQRLEKL